MTSIFQKTVQNNIYGQGLGLHSGRRINVALKPAPAGGGIHFKRLDLADAAPVKAAPENVASTTLATSIGRGDNSVGTVEHLLAALAALGLDNVNVEVDGPELPIFDGSAAPWVDLIKAAGVVTLNAPRNFFKATRSFKTAVGDKSIEVRPAACFSVEAHIDFNGSIGRQAFYYVGSEKAFTSEISSSRTFCLLKDVEMMQSRGLALGGALDNAVVVGDDGIINPEGLRFKDEFVRHKILDFIGDLSIAGAPILGQFILHKPGHELNRRFLAEALAQPGLLELTDARVEDRKKAAADPRPALGRLLALEDMTGQLAALAS